MSATNTGRGSHALPGRESLVLAPDLTVISLSVSPPRGFVTFSIGPFDEPELACPAHAHVAKVVSRTNALVARNHISVLRTFRITIGHVTSCNARPVATAAGRVGLEFIPEIDCLLITFASGSLFLSAYAIVYVVVSWRGPTSGCRENQQYQYDRYRLHGLHHVLRE